MSSDKKELPPIPPCPFCGKSDSVGITGWNGGRRAVKCSSCDITGPVGYLGWTDDRGGGTQDTANKLEAIRLWSFRPLEAKPE